jgi:hypothetical protein
VPYSETTMQSDEARHSGPSGRFFLLLILMGGAIGLALLLLGAPFWLFYVAPTLMAPVVVWELRSLDAAESRKQARLHDLVQRLRSRRSAWVAAALGGIWALVATTSFSRNAQLAGWIAIGGAAACFFLGVWKFLRNKTLLEISAPERMDVLLHFADTQMDEADLPAAIMETEDGWWLVLRERAATDDLLKFSTEKEALQAAEIHGINREEENFLTITLDRESKLRLRELRDREESDA